MKESNIDSKVFEIIRKGCSLLESEDNAELYDKSYLYEYKNIENGLRDNLKRAADEGRRLSIGIVGAAKAGKSSFLNALLFGGEEVLPKAITPSTATLTIISYAVTPKAIVHFFSQEDWGRICGLSGVYEEKLGLAYKEYCEKFEELVKKKENANDKNFSLEEYEINIFRNSYKDERTKAANELKRMVAKENVLELLGSEVELDGDILQKLNNYVDVSGEYTAIVKYVELMINNPGLEGIEVVDTPGLCDPVVSRGQTTKDFLHKCDVVLLLSACSQFMPADTINLMANSLPSAGVGEVLVIGSKYDSGILNDKGGDFLTKAKKSKSSYEIGFLNSMEIIRKKGAGNELTAKIAVSPRYYISSMCYVIDRKMREKKPLNDEEANIYRQLKEYSGFEDTYLSTISGINEVRKALNEIIKNKNEIIPAKDSKLYRTASENMIKILSDIKNYVEVNNIKLQSVSKEEIEERSQKIQAALVLSRKEISSLFDVTGLNCKKKLISTKSVMAQEMANYTTFKISTQGREEEKEVRGGIFGWRRDHIIVYITEYFASTAKIKMNLQNYGAKCMQIINDDFKNLFNKEQFSRSIKEIIMKAYDSGNSDYDKSDILLPIDKLLAQLTIPEVYVNISTYVDVLNSRFNKGYAEGEEIYELESLQAELLGKVEKEFEEKVSTNGEEIVRVMENESICFADNLEQKLAGDKEQLLNQMQEQEKYICLNTNFATALTQLINEYKEIRDAAV